MALLKGAEDSLVGAKMAEIEQNYRSKKAIKKEDIDMLNVCPCDRLLKVSDTEIDQHETLLKYTVPFKVKQTSRPGDIKEPVPKELGPEDPLLTDGSLETQEVLDCIKEPRCWTKNGEKWKQVVSPSTSKRIDIIVLRREFNKRIWDLDARPRGVCRIRFALFSQLFDELTRQVTVTRAERGLFLVRIRSELMDTIHTYHYMWRDTVEYFNPIIEKSVEILAKLKEDVGDLKIKIEEIRREMDEVQWKIHLLEQDRAYERKSLLDWYKCKVHEERITMQQLETLLAVSTPKELDSSRISAISAEESKEVGGATTKTSAEFELIDPLELSDILKDLITERKIAEGRVETKKLLENEITWVKGEISKNKGFVFDLLRLKKPLNFDDWLNTWLEGEEHPGLTAMSPDGVEADFAHVERDSRPSMGELSAKYNTYLNKTLKKWLKSENVMKCSCSTGDGIHDECRKIDFELIKFHAMVEYLKTYDDFPHRKFNQFFNQYLKETKVKDIPILMNHIRSQYVPTPSVQSNQTFVDLFKEPESVEDQQEINEETVSKIKVPFKIYFSSIRDALTRNAGKTNKK